jgi:N-acetylneuraminic acid mutarotase
VLDGLIYVAGGLRGSSVADFAVYDPSRDGWTTLEAMPTARDHLGAVAINGVFYAVGGRAGRLFDVVEVYDPTSGQWSTRHPMPTARGGLALGALGGRLFAMGGEGNLADPHGIFPQTEAYDPVADAWSTLPDMLTPRHGTGAAAVGNRIYVPGGATIAGFEASAANEALQP